MAQTRINQGLMALALIVLSLALMLSAGIGQASVPARLSNGSDAVPASQTATQRLVPEATAPAENSTPSWESLPTPVPTGTLVGKL